MYAYGRYEYDDAIKDWNKDTMYHNVLCSWKRGWKCRWRKRRRRGGL